MPPIAALVGAIISGITALATSAGIGSLVSFASLSAFLASPIGVLVATLAVTLVSSLFFQQKQKAPSMDATKVNVRIAEPERWDHAGVARAGGACLFADFAVGGSGLTGSSGDLWYLLVHSDTRLGNIIKLFFDDIEIQLDVDGWVTTADFCTDDNYDPYVEGSGKPRAKFFQVFTTTYSASDPTPPGIAALIAAFPGKWTTDHRVVGTTYSVIRGKSVPVEHRYKVYKWRGPLGLGEPAFGIAGEWNYCYDPRDVTQTLGNTTTYKFTKNPALIWGWFRTFNRGRDKSVNEINWTKIAEQADICDQSVTDYLGVSRPRYECAIAIPESLERAVAEQQILSSCDGQLVFDDDGKVWPRAGYYYSPTVAFSRNRDIVAMESVEAQNGESETQGVIVRYVDPAARYTTQPSAAWLNPNYYVPGVTPKYLTVDVLCCSDHNQAMRLAKSIGMRSQPLHKITPTVGLRGIKARQERIVSLNYDNTFAGDYEIATPTEIDENGIFTGFGAVPVDADRWTLLAGEERPKPVFSESGNVDTLIMPSGVTLSYTGGQIVATFTPTPRPDWRYEFQCKLTTDPDTKYQLMGTDMINSRSISGTLPPNLQYNVRWRTVNTTGKTTAWFNPPAVVSTAVLTLSGTPFTTGTVGVAYSSWTLGVTGGVSPYLFADLYTMLPPGITINSTTGIISGTPTTAGTYSGIILRVIDFNGSVANFATFTITVT